MLFKGLKTFCVVVLLLSVCISKYAFSNGNGPVQKVLIAGTSADYPPFEFIKDGKIVGFDVDLAYMIAQKLGYELQIQDMKFASIISAIHTERVDFGISGFTITPERKKNVDFSVKYYIPKLAMIYKKENPILSVQDLNKKIIAAQIGTTMESFLQGILKTDKDFKLISLHKTPIMIEELKMGRVDGVFIEESQARAFVAKYPDIMGYSLFKSIEYGYAIVFKKGSVLRADFNKAISELKQSGEINKLKQKWL